MTLTENGLYTLEAWDVFLRTLEPGGLFSVSRWYDPASVSETNRMVSLGVAALLARGIEQRIGARFHLVAAEERVAPAPAAAARDRVAVLRDEVGAVGDQVRVHSEDVPDRGLDLGRRVVIAAESARRSLDQLAQDRDVRGLGETDHEALVHEPSCAAGHQAWKTGAFTSRALA